jgi:predicted mannosyl-3-phosphoglycerate phosphatase (HAD superfamily)|tara:strand:+ start:8134 stop:8442 length:309 start_codon:yes stop_codon:yes gene_type:complete
MCVIAVDFDGTITADPLKAKDALARLIEAGHTIIIWSSRNNPIQHCDSDKMMHEMVQYLKKYEIPFSDIDRGDIGKFHAQVYIDDKAIRFDNNWDEIVGMIY